jgi:hypothetical protein
MKASCLVLFIVRDRSLEVNKLTGMLISEIGLLSVLTDLYESYFGIAVKQCVINYYRYVFDNELTGSLPSELGLLTALVVMYACRCNFLDVFCRGSEIQNNTLSGALPSELRSLSLLTVGHCMLDNNCFTVCIYCCC